MKKILLVEDEPELADLLNLILESEFENEIILAKSGNEACQLLRDKAGEFGVIISDYNMDRGTGGDIYVQNLKGENVPFVLLSGGMISDFPEFKNFTGDNPKNGFVEKPFDEETIIKCVKKAFS